MIRSVLLFIALALSLSVEVAAFAPNEGRVLGRLSSALCMSSDTTETAASIKRRSLVHGAAASIAALFSAPVIAASDTGPQVRGTPVTPFNSLIFQYRGSEFGGLRESDLNEPSVSYAEFCEKLKAGEVEFVEFMAPDGDAAYATFKGKPGAIRVGEGYPVEQHDGWSSPAFAVRTVKNAGVPFKFTVPALASYK